MDPFRFYADWFAFWMNLFNESLMCANNLAVAVKGAANVHMPGSFGPAPHMNVGANADE